MRLLCDGGIGAELVTHEQQRQRRQQQEEEEECFFLSLCLFLSLFASWLSFFEWYYCRFLFCFIGQHTHQLLLVVVSLRIPLSLFGL